MLILLEALAVTCFSVALSWFLKSSSRRPSLPPGPPADPFIGHLRIMPTRDTAETFHEWSKTYGDVMYLKALGREMVILGSTESAQTLLEVRGANYSCRPKFTVFEIMGCGSSLVILQYGKRYLKHRKMLQRYFGGRKQSLAFNDILAEESRLFVKNLCKAAPGRHIHYVQRFTLSNIMQAAFGHRVRSDDEPFVRIVAEAAYGLNNCGPAGSTLPDFFPWLQYMPSWFPGTYYASMARSYFLVVRELHDGIMNSVLEGRGIQSVERSFASVMLKELGDHPDPESIEDVKASAATIIAGGEDTTYSSLLTFLLAMTLHPECQKRAYDEIISVIGHDRFPNITDRERLPFVNSILLETLRWHPAVFLVPHRALKDDIYNGMFIPKGPMVIANIGGMSMDERIYSNPKRFDPTRFLSSPKGRGEPVFNTAVFGFGRRICPGRHYADLELWHAIACTLATLEILPAKDEVGNEKIPEAVFTEGLVSQARPFEFEVQPRSDAARALIASIEA
ncbi:cytochrome P450 [Marasmius fiardii PR-910]|nr:cytochrome P450 [Marasmius fiardii PR-910]